MTKPRCAWCGADPVYVAYHDDEWGVPIHDPRALWECLCLESFQAGLSWITILRRRPAFRAAFAGFDPAVVARWGEADVQRLLADAGIIRHRCKIESTIRSAQIYVDIQAGEGFAPFLWAHVDHRPMMCDGMPPQALALSKSLKSRGFKFCGPTITYAFMQAVGMVNDHAPGCFRYSAAKS